MNVYPSTTHLLPGGYASFVIPSSDTRGTDSLRLLTSASDVFVLCMSDGEPKELTTLPAIGTVVKVIQRDARQDAAYTTIVEGCYKVELLSLDCTEDNLLFAEIRRAANWTATSTNSKNAILSHKLEDLYLSVPEIRQLYPSVYFDDITWVTQRWLEILPLETVHKRMLISQPTSDLTQRFLLKLLHDKNWI